MKSHPLKEKATLTISNFSLLFLYMKKHVAEQVAIMKK